MYSQLLETQEGFKYRRRWVGISLNSDQFWGSTTKKDHPWSITYAKIGTSNRTVPYCIRIGLHKSK